MMFEQKRHRCTGCKRIFDCYPCPHKRDKFKQRAPGYFCSVDCIQLHAIHPTQAPTIGGLQAQRYLNRALGRGPKRRMTEKEPWPSHKE